MQCSALCAREELNQHNEQLRQQLKRAGEACGFQCERQGVIPRCASSGTGVAGTSTARETTESPGGSTTPSRKRPASTATQDSPARKRRAVAFGSSTPVRRALATMVPSEGSPAVAVS